MTYAKSRIDFNHINTFNNVSFIFNNNFGLNFRLHPVVREDSRAFNDMRDVKTIIIELQDKVREQNVEPVAVQLQDFIQVVVQEAKDELWELIKNKEIIYHQTLNGHSFSVPEGDNNNINNEQRTG